MNHWVLPVRATAATSQIRWSCPALYRWENRQGLSWILEMWSLLNTRWKRVNVHLTSLTNAQGAISQTVLQPNKNREWKGLSPSSNFQHGQRDCKILLVSKAGLMVGNKCFFSQQAKLPLDLLYFPVRDCSQSTTSTPILPCFTALFTKLFSLLPAPSPSPSTDLTLLQGLQSLHFECMRAAVLWCIHHNSAPNPLSREVNKYSNC